MRRWGIGLLIVIGLVSATMRAHADTALSEIRASHARVRDLVMDVDRKEVREKELQSLRRNASSALEFSRIKVTFMAPDRLRMEGKRGLVPITMIEDDGVQIIRLALGIKKRIDVSDNPRKKQGGMEFGLLSEQVWNDYQITEVGRETFDNQPAIVLQLKVRHDLDGGFHKVWVDTATFRVLRRDRLTADGKLKYRQVFRQPVQTPAGTWLSRRIEIHNQHGRFVGALETSGLRINQGVAPELFRM